MENTQDYSALIKFQDTFFSETIRWAVNNTRYYRELYNGYAVPESVVGLPSLPLTYKPELRNAGWLARVREMYPVLRQHTTGSTGIPYVIYYSDREIEFCHDFHAAAAEERSGADGPSSRGLVLHLASGGHGANVSMPSPFFTIHASLNNIGFLPSDGKLGLDNPESAAAILLSDHDIPGVQPHVTAISCGRTQFITMSRVLEYYGFPFDKTHVSTIALTGSLITGRLRNLLGAQWNATVFDVFSCSEVAGNAPYCSICDAWHFSPEVVAEVIDPITLKNSVSGEYGLLVLTSLYPFRQMQPTIRYVNGDVGRIMENRCGKCAPAIRIEGRSARSWVAPDGSIVLPERVIAECIDNEPLLARSTCYPSRQLLHRYPFLSGHGEVWRMMRNNPETGRATLFLCPSFDPFFYRAMAEDLKDSVRVKLLREVHPEHHGKLDIEFKWPLDAV